MDAMETLKTYSKEFLQDPEAFGYEAFADGLHTFAENATEDELKQLAQWVLSK